MSRIITAVFVVLAVTAASGCDDMIQRVTESQGPSALKQDDGAIEGKGGECGSCAKFRARPPSGINAPPAL